MKGRTTSRKGRHPKEDTNAILTRRRFLIEAALAGAGVGAVASRALSQGASSPPASPRPCLVKPCLSEYHPGRSGGTPVPPAGPPATNAIVAPRPCLEVASTNAPPAGSPPTAPVSTNARPRPKRPNSPAPGLCLSIEL